MQFNLESLESIAYSKLAEFIQSERLQEASFLVDILSKLNKTEAKYPILARTSGGGLGALGLAKSLPKEIQTSLENLSSDFIGSGNYTPYNYSSASKAHTLPNSGSNKASEYNWNDGSKDPREDYWRDG